jgi:hypothetical protein
VDDLLTHPAFHGGIAPFAVALVVAVALHRLQLAGLSVLAAFMTCMYLVSGLQLTPLTATRKVMLVGVLAGVVGVAWDRLFTPARHAATLAALAAVGTVWVFWSVLVQKPTAEAWLLGASAAFAVAFLVGSAQRWLAADGIRAGAAALGLGVGVGIAAIFSASATYGLYGIAIGAGAGAFLLPQMIVGRKWLAGSAFVLPAMLLSGLVGAGAMILAQLPWYSQLLFALVPLAACAPTMVAAPIWLQATMLSAYSISIAALASILAWPGAQQT